ncbi:MAG: hydantoinase/oxoprolinase family protein [Bilifractor sp.]
MTGIGIDTGGTYTDIVVYDMDNGKVLDAGKTPTTKEHLETCILRALDSMDQRFIHQAQLLALSTTLATNACLENKGGRAKCLMIGMQPESMRNLKEVYGSYGLSDLDQLVFMDGKPEHVFSDPEEPDWEKLRLSAQDWFRGCRAVGVTQIYPDANGGRFEREAERILRERGFQVTTAWNMFQDVDVLRRGAGTLLNARLIPIISEFLESVRSALLARGLSLPIVIIAGNGNQMAESVARRRPVETLLSGPAASAVGGSIISGEPDGILVDMGGTTTDIALVRDGQPVMADQGISIGGWRTTVQGLYVDTTLLGGDSEVLFDRNRILLGKERVIPISALVSMYPAQAQNIIHKLRLLAHSGRKHTRMLHEFMVLQRNILEDPELCRCYTEQELRICKALKNGPLILEEFAEQTGTSVYHTCTDRLEAEGVIIRSGLTPTDMMVLKGDIDLYGRDSADAVRAAVQFVIRNTDPENYHCCSRPHVADEKAEINHAEEECACDARQAEAVADEVYRCVEKKMYRRIAEILLARQYPGHRQSLEQDGVKKLIDWSFDEAWSREKERELRCGGEVQPAGSKRQDNNGNQDGTSRQDKDWSWVHFGITTKLPLIGAGAPTHIFLPMVAKMLGTRAVLHPYAGVANALGAIAGKVSGRASVHVKADYLGAVPDGFSVTDQKGKHKFENYEDAERYAEQLAEHLARDEARRQGAGEHPDLKLRKRQIRTTSGMGPEVFFETVVEATASGRYCIDSHRS